MDSVGGRFSCTVHSDDEWYDHTQAMLAFLDRAATIIMRARACGVLVQFDVAVEPEDYENRNITTFVVDVELMQRLAAQGVVLAFTLYPG